MAQEEPKGSEIVSRVIIRLPDEMARRPTQDAQDFERKKDYKSTGKPENGLSFLRRSILQTPADLYNYIGSKKPMGFSECSLDSLTAKGLKYKVTGKNNEHLSVRCADCNMSEDKDKGIVCQPNGAADFSACLFFGDDPYDLDKVLTVVETPATRAPAKKP